MDTSPKAGSPLRVTASQINSPDQLSPTLRSAKSKFEKNNTTNTSLDGTMYSQKQHITFNFSPTVKNKGNSKL